MINTIFIEKLKKAILNVNEEYCVWEYKSDKPLQKTERVFCYELYHQFKKTTKIIKCNYQLNGEPVKHLNDKNLIEYCGINDLSYKKLDILSPDLVLHLSQSSREQSDQILIIEVKTKKVSKKEIQKTIIKLYNYINLLNFQWAIFISVNTDFTKLRKQILNCIPNPEGKNWADNFKRILLINYNNQKLDEINLYKLFLKDSDI